jgi:hypothetical protein
MPKGMLQADMQRQIADKEQNDSSNLPTHVYKTHLYRDIIHPVFRSIHHHYRVGLINSPLRSLLFQWCDLGLSPAHN